MMREVLAFIAVLSPLSAQPSGAQRLAVPAGTQAEIVLRAPKAHAGDRIDLVTSDPKRHVITVVLPDGRELTQNNADSLGFVWNAVQPAEFKNANPRIYNLMLGGNLPHIVVGFTDHPPRGDYRVRVDARQSKSTARVEALYVSIADILMTRLRTTPGVEITHTMKVPAHSTTKVTVGAGSESGDGILDIALTDPHVIVGVRFPDGRLLTEANAKANGVDWTACRWPPDDGGVDFLNDFAAAMIATMMLPVDGTHQVISLRNGSRDAGKYVVEVDARGSDRSSDLTAMFFPVKLFDKEFEEMIHPPLKRGEVRAVSYAPDGEYRVNDEIELVFGLEGELVREPLLFRSRGKILPPGLDQKERAIDVAIRFTVGGDGRYRGIFVPLVPGIYNITTEVRGKTTAGRVFYTEAWSGTILVRPLPH